MSETYNTHDLLRPTATRATGTRAWVWYVAIGAFAFVIIVYLTNIFMAKPPPALTATTSSDTPPTLQASEAFRYSGRVVSNAAGTLPQQAAASSTGIAGSGVATNTTPRMTPALPTVPPANQTYGMPNTNVPDVSAASAGYARIPLPTAAPDDGHNAGAPAQPLKRSIQIVYGAPETADTPVPLTTPPIRVALGGGPPVITAFQTPVTMPAAGGLAGASSETMPGRRRAPSARYMLAAGTKIYAQVQGYIQSDMPGPVTAQVVTPAIDSLTGEVLVPAGAQVLGYYSGLTANASALTITWTRLMFPDRSSFALDRLPALNEDGHMGVSGSYDDHRGTLFRSTFIGAILSAVAQKFLGTSSSTTNVYISAPGGASQQPYAASAQMILDLVTQLNARDGQKPPTIVIPANTPVEIYVDRDMIFDGPYTPMRAAS